MHEVPFRVVRDISGSDGAGHQGSAVTVAVTLYDYGHFLVECLDSVAAQDHPRLELIVVDDASRDDSLAVAERWIDVQAPRFNRARLVTHADNSGLAEARNTGLRLASDDLVFVLDADNALYPRAISRLCEAIDETGASVAYCQLEHFGDERRLGEADIWNRDLLRQYNYVDAMSLVRRSAWEAAGGYTPMHGWEDYDLWCKFVERGFKGVFVPEILCRYRVHGKSMLRTETLARRGTAMSHMQMRHPWLLL